MTIFIHLNRKGSASFNFNKEEMTKVSTDEISWFINKKNPIIIITMSVLVNDVNVNIILWLFPLFSGSFVPSFDPRHFIHVMCFVIHKKLTFLNIFINVSQKRIFLLFGHMAHLVFSSGCTPRTWKSKIDELYFGLSTLVTVKLFFSPEEL